MQHHARLGRGWRPADPDPRAGLDGRRGSAGRARGPAAGAWARRRGRRARAVPGHGRGAGLEFLTIGETPHEWLFPRMAAVAHHCGAGTTAAGLRAGVPTVGIPVVADQPFWASRVVTLGVGPRPVPLKGLTADRLAAALRAAVDDGRHRSRATEVAADLRGEDGTDGVAAGLERLV